jgi:hypothetical protein
MFARYKRININVRIGLVVTCLICIKYFHATSSSVDGDGKASKAGLFNIRPPDKSTQSYGENELSILIADYQRKFSKPPPSNFEAWHRFAVAKSCSLDLNDYAQISFDLQPFRNPRNTISEEILDAGKQLAEVSVFEIIDGNLYTIHSQDRTKRTEAKKLNWILVDVIPILPSDKKITLLVNRARMPRILSVRNGASVKLYKNLQEASSESSCLSNNFKSVENGLESYYNSSDLLSITTQLIPVFSSRKLACFRDLLMPDLVNLHDIKQSEEVFIDDFWDSKLNRMMVKSSANQHRFGLSLTKLNFEDNELKAIIFESDSKSNFEFYKSKYLLKADENNSLTSILMNSRSLVFFNSIFTQWYTRRVKPWLHYIPVMSGGSDLETNLKWSLANEIRAKEIADEGFSLARKKLRTVDMKCYLALLLLEYSDLIQ